MIDIGVNSGLDGYGVTIKYHDSRLYTQPYEWDDIISENEEEPMYKIIYQKLILNKSEYDIGDSLYGRVEFKIIEKNKYSGRREHLGKGNFRAKILKDQFSL